MNVKMIKIEGNFFKLHSAHINGIIETWSCEGLK